jgi:DNA-binding transcriptional LysR family regulator
MTDPPDEEQLLRLELRHLAAIAALAMRGSTAAAAASLHVDQALLRAQLVALEQAVGAQLVDWDAATGEAALTPAGLRMAAHADRIVAQLRLADANDQVRRGGAIEVRLTLGVTATLAARFGPALLSRMRRRHPGVGLALCEAASGAELLALLADGELDLAFGEAVIGDGPFLQEVVAFDRYVAIAPHDAPVARCRPARVLAELAARPLVTPSDDVSTRRVERRMGQDGLRPRWLGRSDAHATIAALVRSGAGHAVLPSLAVGPAYAELATVDLSTLLDPIVLALTWHADRGTPPLLETLCRQARAVCDGLISDGGAA